jgi:transposase
MVDELGIVDVIDDAISQDHEKRQLSIGQTIKALIINGLGFIGRPMYLTPQFFATKPTELLVGKGVKAEHLNENTIGRAMDSLYKHCKKRTKRATHRIFIRPPMSLDIRPAMTELIRPLCA